MSEIKTGDRVKVSSSGLVEHSRSIPAHMGFTTHEMTWRNILLGFKQAGTIGAVTRVSNDGQSFTVDFGGTLIWVPHYMVAPV